MLHIVYRDHLGYIDRLITSDGVTLCENIDGVLQAYFTDVDDNDYTVDASMILQVYFN